MLIKREDARRHENSSTCTVWEHDHPSKDLSYAVARIDGTYPENSKKAKNLECDTIFIGISGSGTIHSEKGDFLINPQDSYYIPKGEKYSIVGQNLLLGISNSPRWTPEQYKEVD
jgi:mannose-6-phosphate isomerase-like protein (cupin superfamily)